MQDQEAHSTSFGSSELPARQLIVIFTSFSVHCFSHANRKFRYKLFSFSSEWKKFFNSFLSRSIVVASSTSVFFIGKILKRVCEKQGTIRLNIFCFATYFISEFYIKIEDCGRFEDIWSRWGRIFHSTFIFRAFGRGVDYKTSRLYIFYYLTNKIINSLI